MRIARPPVPTDPPVFRPVLPPVFAPGILWPCWRACATCCAVGAADICERRERTELNSVVLPAYVGAPSVCASLRIAAERLPGFGWLLSHSGPPEPPCFAIVSNMV